ncbi:MAG: hypothetical protein IPK18_07870 [Sphingobacteriales bacterium]|nr:MAG: hypothetical protein IPK18_07870 [Sphingobacteriales bacterium]
MHFKNILLIALFTLVNILPNYAQQENLYLNREMSIIYEKDLNKMDKPIFHSSIKPYNAGEVYEHVYPDTIIRLNRLKKNRLV